MLGKFTIVNKGLRYKLLIAFSLMSVIPILTLTYVIINFIFPQIDELTSTSVVILITLIISGLGMYLARGLIDPIIDMAIEARVIASGDFNRHLKVSGEDEVGNLAGSINVMTQKIRSNMDELKNYSQRMREINVDINKKVLALSSLLQIGDMLSSGAVDIDPLLDLAVEKVALVFDGGYAALFLPKDSDDLVLKAHYNLESGKLHDLVIRKGVLAGLEKTRDMRECVIIDKSSKDSKETESLKAAYDVVNAVILPIHSGARMLAVLFAGNRIGDYKFKDDDVETVKVFARQITIAMETDILNKKNKELSIKDDLTDIYNKSFIMTRLEEEIKRAIFYQRPCSLIAFNVDGFSQFRKTYGEIPAEDALIRIAKIIKDNTTPIGKAARTGADEFAILLPEKNKREAVNMAEEIRKKIEMTNLIKDDDARLTVSIGVSENPIDGATADELYKKAVTAIKQAKSSGKNRIAV